MLTAAVVIVCSLYIFSSLILMIYGVQCYVMTYLFLRARKKTIPVQRKKMTFFNEVTDEDAYPLVVTQLPMYNEQSVAIRVIEAAAAMDYPRGRHEIQVLDDSTDSTRELVDRTVERLKKQGVIISTIRRDTREGFKAGALQNGLRYTKAEFVAIFDADFVPQPDFLRKSVAFFMYNPKLGLVQGRWAHLNMKSSMLTRGQAMGIDGHFVIEQAARCWNNLFMNFNGTAGIFRRTAIETSGGWQHDTLTEDMDLSYRIQLKGWQTEYVPDIEVPAEIPEDINGFKNQQFRWAKGSIQTAKKIIPRLIHLRPPAFTLIQAVLHLTHYAVHPFMLTLALLTTPVLLLVKISLPAYFFAPVVLGMLLSTSGPSTMYMVAQRHLGKSLRKKLLLVPMMMLIGVGLAVNNTKAVVEALIGKESPFHRTPKKGTNRKAAAYRPIKDITCVLELFMGFYCLAGFQMFFTHSSLFVTPFLIIYAAGFLFVGMLSIIHYHKPETITMRFRRPRLADAPA